MTSSENLEPWMFRPTFTDSWFSEAFVRDTETLTKALQKSISSTNSESLTSDSLSPFLINVANSVTAQTPTVSSVSGSDPETATKRRSTIPTGNGGKITKRKSRASKRCQTTFITADPANFRQMVQQVTGVRFGNSQQAPVMPILKPEPQRPCNRFQGCLPTLDTSAFLLDHHHHHQQQQPQQEQEQEQVGPSTSSIVGGLGHVSVTSPSVMVGDGGSGLDFDTFPSFPTLESWKVM